MFLRTQRLLEVARMLYPQYKWRITTDGRFTYVLCKAKYLSCRVINYEEEGMMMKDFEWAVNDLKRKASVDQKEMPATWP